MALAPAMWRHAETRRCAVQTEILQSTNHRTHAKRKKDNHANGKGPAWVVALPITAW